MWNTTVAIRKAIIKVSTEHLERHRVKYQKLKKQSITTAFTNPLIIKTTIEPIKTEKRTQGVMAMPYNERRTRPRRA
jgi:hypothetical protein